MASGGREALLEVLRTEGVRHVFGNPGTTELPLVDALAAVDDIHYVLSLQEATAVGMADGYAQATRRPAFLNLHTSAGLGNAIGNLTNAQANGTPLVVTAGQQDRRHRHHDPLLAGDLVGLARPVSKWAHEINTLDEIGVIMRRAFHDATSPPSGPVFVSIPMDLLEEEGDAHVPAPSRLERGATPAPELLDELAARLSGGDRVAIVAGDEVAASGAVPALVAVAEALGCSVHGSPLHSNVVFPTTHPLWANALPPSAGAIASALAAYDVVLLVGGRAFMVYPFAPGPAVPESVALLHLSPDPHQLGRTWPVELGVVGDPKSALEALRTHLGPARDLTTERDARAALDDRFDGKAREGYDATPMPPASAVHALLRAMPPGTPVVDEAITTGSYVRGYLRADPDEYYFCRGGGLGWGMPAALGVSLARDRSPVLCVVGDGSAMYSPQALWTAAAQDLPVVFAVVNNRQYLILKNYLRGMKAETVRTGRYVGMDLDAPPVDFVALARSMGVDASLVTTARDVGDALQAALSSGRPHLLELPIDAP